MRNKCPTLAHELAKFHDWRKVGRFELKRSKLRKFWIQWTFNMVTFLNQRSQKWNYVEHLLLRRFTSYICFCCFFPVVFGIVREGSESSNSLLFSTLVVKPLKNCSFQTTLKCHLDSRSLFFFVKLTSQRGPNNLDLSGIVYFPQNPVEKSQSPKNPVDP